MNIDRLCALKFELWEKREEQHYKMIKSKSKIRFKFDNPLFKKNEKYFANIVYGIYRKNDSDMLCMIDVLDSNKENYLIENELVEEYSENLFVISKVYKFNNKLELYEINHTTSEIEHYRMLEILTY